MEKIALCFYGFLRDWKVHRASINKTILKEYDADLYISTPYQRKEDSEETVSSGEIEKNYKNLKAFHRWDYNAKKFVNKTDHLPKLNEHKQMPHRIFSMFFHISKSVQLCKESGNEYDWILVTRPDVTIKGLNLSVASKNSLNIRKGMAHYVEKHDVKFDDKFLLGDQRMLKLSTLYEKVFEYAENDEFREPVPAPNEIICHHLVKDGWNINRCDFMKDFEFEHTCSDLCGHKIINGERTEDFEVEDVI